MPIERKRTKQLTSSGWIGAALLLVLASPVTLYAQADVSLRVSITHKLSHEHKPVTQGGIVAWLVPLQAQSPAPRPAQQYTLSQKDKQFLPHVLVVPTGSSVDFPNLDPFFHNVFSLFNGKRFDLGLYEAHTHRIVHFDREGISYIFCNIHPQMGAVILTLDTPFYGTSAPDGTIHIENIPLGNYRLTLWAEDVTRERLDAAASVIHIKSAHEQLAPITLQGSSGLMGHHTNKFGDPYEPLAKDPY